MKFKKRLLGLFLAVVCILTLAVPCAAANTYSDWFKPYYSEIVQLGLLPDSFAGLDLRQNITRAEMCKLAVYAFEKATGNKNDFLDENGNLIQAHYFSDTTDEYISKAFEYGIVNGYPDGTFRPNQYLTRQEFFQIVKNFCYSAAFKPTADGASISGFIDANKVAGWAEDAAKVCVKYGYVQGTTTKNGVVLNPTNTTSRQEAMTMFLRCYKVLQEYYYELVLSAGVVSGTGDRSVTLTEGTATKYVEPGTTLNVRDSWNTNGKIIGRLSPGTKVSVTGFCSNGWVRISYNGGTAYVFGSYLVDSQGGSGSGSGTGGGGGSGSGTGGGQTLPVATGSGSAADIANYAVGFVGYNYVWGGTSPSTGFDCSGLVYYCYRTYGYNTINRVADDQMNQGVSIAKSDLAVGDLVFFGSGDYANHVGIYIGGGNFVHASTPSTGVRINSLDETYYTKNYIGARRLIQ